MSHAPRTLFRLERGGTGDNALVNASSELCSLSPPWRESLWSFRFSKMVKPILILTTKLRVLGNPENCGQASDICFFSYHKRQLYNLSEYLDRLAYCISTPLTLAGVEVSIWAECWIRLHGIHTCSIEVSCSLLKRPPKGGDATQRSRRSRTISTPVCHDYLGALTEVRSCGRVTHPIHFKQLLGEYRQAWKEALPSPSLVQVPSPSLVQASNPSQMSQI